MADQHRHVGSRVTGHVPLSTLRPTARRTLYALRQAGEKGCTNGELLQPSVGGNRFGARLHELREAGCVIFRVELRPGRYRYWLTRDVYEPQRVLTRAHDQVEPQLDLTDLAA
jgi:hypothetical protein